MMSAFRSKEPPSAANAPSVPPKTVLEIILDWSKDRPAWQRDALRRIVQAQKLIEVDVEELSALCKRGRTDKPPEAEPEPQPLEF